MQIGITGNEQAFLKGTKSTPSFFYSCLFSSTALMTHLGVYDVYHFFYYVTALYFPKVHNKSHVDVSFILAKVHQ